MTNPYTYVPALRRAAKTLAPLILCGCGMGPYALRPDVGSVSDLAAQVVTTAKSALRAGHPVVPGSYIVTFRAQPGASRLGFASFAAEFSHHYSFLAENFLSDPRIQGINYITAVNLAHPQNPKLAAILAPPRALRLLWNADQVDEVPGIITVVDFDGEASAASLLSEWEAQGAIWYAEPNYINKLMDGGASPFTQDLATQYSSIGDSGWWQALIKLPAALTALIGKPVDQAPVIAVLDSGVDIQHKQLASHIWKNPAAGQSGCGDDQHGCDTTASSKGVLGVGTVFPYLTTGYGQPCPNDDAVKSGGATQAQREENGVCGHGTHVSGIIAADVGSGVGGVCPVCQIMPIKIIGSSGTASDAAILAGFKYLTRFKTDQNLVRVVNSSFGKYARDRSVALLVSVLKEPPNSVLVVGAAGNEDSMLRSFPGALPDAIAVTAIAGDKGKSSYSNFGPWAGVAAPGGDERTGQTQISSTVPGGGVGEKMGTSMACPVVAGVAGLVLAIDRTRSWQDLHDSIELTADPSLYDPSVFGGINYTYYDAEPAGEKTRWPLLGAGIVDAAAALANDKTSRSGVLGPKLSRVDGSCGTTRANVAGAAPTPRRAFGLALLLVLPGLIAGITARRRSGGRW